MSDIWIINEDKEKTIEDIKNHDESDPLYVGHTLDELYVDMSTGNLDGFMQIGNLGIGINIPFEEWVRNFIRLGVFENLPELFERKREELIEAQKSVEEIREQYLKINNTLSETVKTEGDE